MRLEDALISVRLRPADRLLLITALRLLLLEFTVPEEERRDEAEERVPLLLKEDEERLPLLRKEEAEERVPFEAIELREPDER